MLSLLSRLITSNRIFKNDKLFSFIEQPRKSQFSLNVPKASDTCADPQPPNYVTCLAMPWNHHRVLEFLRCTYFKYDPAIVNIGLCGVPPTAAMLNLTMSKIKNGMTMIAVDCDNCIIGAAVNAGGCPWDPRKMDEYAKCCEEEGLSRDLIEFFAYVSRKPDVWNRYNVLKVFECRILAVLREYRETDLARKLLEESWYLARDCGYRLFRIDCTSRDTATLADCFKWQNICTIPYCRYVKNGEMVFKHIQEPNTEVEVYIDPLTYCDSYTLPYKCQKRK